MKDDWSDMSMEMLERIGAIRDGLTKKQTGEMNQGIENCVTVLEQDPLFQGAIRENQMTGRMDIIKDLGWKRDPVYLSITDNDLSNIYLYFEKFYGLKSDKNIMKAIRVVANRHSYHPLREYLESLRWDGEDRIRKALHKFMGADESDLTYECFKVFLMGALDRLYNPGCKFEIMLCLVGDQGAGKSSFFRFLALRDEWFSDDIKKLDDENVYRKMAGHGILEMAEMLGTANAKSVEEIKAFLSRQKETYKDPYDKFPKDRPRQCVFVGTTNKQRFLPLDRTGNRRFYPIQTNSELAEIHVLKDEAFTRNYIRQLWAEALGIYNSGEWTRGLPESMEQEMNDYRMNFMAEDTTTGMIQEWLDEYKGDFVCTKLIYNEAYHMTGEPDRKMIGEINDVMNNTVDGWTAGPQHRFPVYGQQRSWKRIPKTVNRDGDLPEGFERIQEGDTQLKLPFDIN